MTQSTRKGTLLLTGSQMWHALSGYVIFLTAARILGDDASGGRFGDFGLVVWTMTALESFVTTGVPKAVAYFTARAPLAVRGIYLRGLVLTTVVSVALAALLAAFAPWLTSLWRDESLTYAVRLAALDFVAFVPFCVVVNAVNGLRDYQRQATVWLCYSTTKVVVVVALLMAYGTIEAGVFGYVFASGAASLIAWLAARRQLASQNDADVPTSSALCRFGFPVALQAVALMLLLNLDQWAAKRVAADSLEVDRYVAASTLARVLFFVFTAFGEALFPAVAAARAAGDYPLARTITRDGIGLLACFLIPIGGLGIGAAGPALSAVFGEGYGEGAAFVQWLVPATCGLTLMAVLGALLGAAGSPRAAAVLALSVMACGGALAFELADRLGAEGAAIGAAITGVGGAVLLMLLISKGLGGNVVPTLTLLVTTAAGALLALAISAWAWPGWWVFVEGTLLLLVVLAGLKATGFLVLGKVKAARS